MEDNEAAHQHRLLMAEKTLKLFHITEGHACESREQLEEWFVTKRAQAILKEHRNDDGHIIPDDPLDGQPDPQTR